MLASSPPDRSRARRLLSSALAFAFSTSLLTAAFVFAVPSKAANAAALDTVITSVQTTKEHYGWNERLTLAFTWALPESAETGDTFSLDLPDELKAASLATFTLDAPDGTPIVTARWQGKSVVFTLTDYVESHDEIYGAGHLTVQWDHAVIVETTDPIVLQFGGSAVEVTIGPKPVPAPPCTENCPPPNPPATSRNLSKGGSWSDGSFEGTRDETGNISWTISLPGNPEGFDAPVTVIDEVGPGSVIECATVALTTQQGLASGAVRTPVDPARIDIDCGPQGFTVNLDSIGPNEFIRITYRGTITQQGLGVYTNTVTVEIAGTQTERSTTMRRTSAGGSGVGVQSVSVGDFVWLDENRDGRQDDGEPGIAGVVLVLTGPDGGPVTSIDGALVGPATTDADGRYGFTRLPVLQPGEFYTVTIDVDASSEALADLSPTTPGVGDRAGDSSTNSATSLGLHVNGAADLTLDFGFVAAELPTLPLPEPEEEGTDDPESGRLASTGLSSTDGIMALGAVLLTLGAVIGGAALRSRARVGELS